MTSPERMQRAPASFDAFPPEYRHRESFRSRSNLAPALYRWGAARLAGLFGAISGAGDSRRQPHGEFARSRVRRSDPRRFGCGGFHDPAGFRPQRVASISPRQFLSDVSDGDRPPGDRSPIVPIAIETVTIPVDSGPGGPLRSGANRESRGGGAVDESAGSARIQRG